MQEDGGNLANFDQRNNSIVVPDQYGQLAVQLKFILREEAILPCGAAYVGTGHGKEYVCRRALEEVSEGVTGEGGLEGELSEIIGRQEELNVEVANAACVDSRRK